MQSRLINVPMGALSPKQIDMMIDAAIKLIFVLIEIFTRKKEENSGSSEPLRFQLQCSSKRIVTLLHCQMEGDEGALKRAGATLEELGEVRELIVKMIEFTRRAQKNGTTADFTYAYDEAA